MKLVHLSDLHFPAERPEQAEALRAAVESAGAELVAVTGDLTRAGRRREFEAASAFLGGLSAPVLAVPGNHDVPVYNLWARFVAPFGRFDAHIMPSGASLESGGLQIVALNTAKGVRMSTWDWSLGAAAPGRVARAVEKLRQGPEDACRVVLTHHPLVPEPHDARRSRTKGGAKALERLAEAGLDVLLFGHLHAPSVRSVEAAGRRVTLVGAPAALGDRDRGYGAGFNLLEFSAAGLLRVVHWRWSEAGYAPVA